MHLWHVFCIFDSVMNKIDKKQAKVKKILLDSGYVSAYYRIMDVMNGNRSSTNPYHEVYAFKWGRHVLYDKEDSLKRKYPNYRLLIANEARFYLDSLRKLDDIITLTIGDNISKQFIPCKKNEEDQ